MKMNAIINARFIDLLNILDMRVHITVYGYSAQGKQIIIFDGMPVYEILMELRNEANQHYKGYEVYAINTGLVTNILIGNPNEECERYVSKDL